MRSIKAIRHFHVGESKIVTQEGGFLKGIVVSPFTGSTGKLAVCNTATKAGTFSRSTTTATITSNNHGLVNGQWAWLEWSLIKDVYAVTVVNANTFTVTVADSGAFSGNVTVYGDIVFQVDMSDPVTFSINIPEPGIAFQGMFLGMPPLTHASVLYTLAQ
jgi:hypothetical protein